MRVRNAAKRACHGGMKSSSVRLSRREARSLSAFDGIAIVFELGFEGQVWIEVLKLKQGLADDGGSFVAGQLGEFRRLEEIGEGLHFQAGQTKGVFFGLERLPDRGPEARSILDFGISASRLAESLPVPSSGSGISRIAY